jgi:hypothetical protein
VETFAFRPQPLRLNVISDPGEQRMKLIGSRRRERVGKPGLIEDEQRMVRALLACGSSAEKARMQVFSVRCQALSATSGLAVSFSDSALLCRSWSINSSSASLAITAVWSLQ